MADIRKAICRSLIGALLMIAVPVSLPGQREDKEGKAWLESCSETATINVAGLWRSPEWGRLSLNQRADTRTIIGSGDGWDISGVVSGKSVCLVFSHRGKVAYSAKLAVEAPNILTGVYANGLLSPKSKTVPMRLEK